MSDICIFTVLTITPITMDTKERWLEKSFEHFAEYGPNGISIQRIAEEIQVPRTTFYHHFADRDDLEDQLLSIYLERIELFSQEGEERCRCLIPDLHELLADYPTGLKFSRQLFLHRSHPIYNMVFVKGRDRANRFIIPLFRAYYQFNIPDQLATDLWNSLSESWYSRLHPEELSVDSMRRLTEEIMETVNKFVRTKLFSQIQQGHPSLLS